MPKYLKWMKFLKRHMELINEKHGAVEGFDFTQFHHATHESFGGISSELLAHAESLETYEAVHALAEALGEAHVHDDLESSRLSLLVELHKIKNEKPLAASLAQGEAGLSEPISTLPPLSFSEGSHEIRSTQEDPFHKNRLEYQSYIKTVRNISDEEAWTHLNNLEQQGEIDVSRPLSEVLEEDE
ncbi:MAG: hypothetical protein GOV15_03690 [Candidatus Diapherotrites archaeon]|nr:hypothetical protein [Candidatus Diapherotrites archaeon]